MEEKYLYQLAEFVLPSDALNYFTTPGSSLLLIFLDEKMEEGHSDDIHFESRDFMDPVEMTDFFIPNRSLENFAFILSENTRYIAIIMSEVIYFLQ